MDFTILGVGAVALTGVLTQVIKQIGFVPKKVFPAVPLIVGLAVTLLGTFSFGLDIILTGLVVGGLSMGAFDVVKKIVPLK